MKLHKTIIYPIIGICLIVISFFLMSEFLFKFLKFAIGLIIFIIGLNLMIGRRY